MFAPQRCHHVQLLHVQINICTNRLIIVTLDMNATKAHNVSAWLNDTKFNQFHHVVVGSLVMFTSNVNVTKKVLNTATATITSVHPDNHGVVTTIGVQLIGTSTEIFFKRLNSQHNTNEQYYYKVSFPIVVTYAMTNYSSQGATISNKIIVAIQSTIAHGLRYVMQSRTTNRQNLKIVRRLVRSNLIPLPLFDTNWSPPVWQPQHRHHLTWSDGELQTSGIKGYM